MSYSKTLQPVIERNNGVFEPDEPIDLSTARPLPEGVAGASKTAIDMTMDALYNMPILGNFSPKQIDDAIHIQTDLKKSVKWFIAGMPDDPEEIKRVESLSYADLFYETPYADDIKNAMKEGLDTGIQTAGMSITPLAKYAKFPEGEAKETIVNFYIENISTLAEIYTDPASLIIAHVIGAGFRKIPQALERIRNANPDLYNLLIKEIGGNKVRLKAAFKTLGLDLKSSDTQIRMRYRKLSLENHPDRGGDAAKFSQVEEAYKTIQNTRESIMKHIVRLYKNSKLGSQKGFARIGEGNFPMAGGLVPRPKSPLVSPGKVKPIIHKATGFKKTVDNIVENEYKLLTEQIKMEAKAHKEGYALGKKEIRAKDKIKRDVENLVASLQAMGQRKLPVEYKEQVDAILEKYDLKRRTEATKQKRVFRTAFIDVMREQGDLGFVPKDFFRDYGEKTTLDEMTLEDLEHLHNQVKVLVTAGSNENKLISQEKEVNFEKALDRIVSTIYKRGKKSPPSDEELLEYKPPSAQKDDMISKVKEKISKYFSGHRKVENVTKVLRIWNDVWLPIQRGFDAELVKGKEMSDKFKQIFAPLAKKSVKMMTETITISGAKHPITRWEAIGVALNSENPGNVERLMKGNLYSRKQIEEIKDKLTNEEKQFVDDVFDLINSYWSEIESNMIKAVGIKPKKITSGKYFPIKPDYSQDVDAQMREAQKDLMQEMFSRAFLEKGFTEPRVGGKGAVDLNILPVILKHLQDVIHYNAFVLPMRDVQKIIYHPRFKKAIIDIMNEPTYNEFKAWLADAVNPKSLMPRNIFEVLASITGRNATAAILGWKTSVSLLQGGSFSQTIKEIGVINSARGVIKFWRHPFEVTEFVYANSPEMKNRSILWDRELKNWLETKQAKQILHGLPRGAKTTLFIMMRGVDFVTVMPSWIAEYDVQISIHGDNQKAKEESDSLIRRSQPMASKKDLPRMLRGNAFQNLFSMFKSFYVTMHNQIVDIKDEYRFSDEPFIGKTGKAAVAFFWVWVVPSIFATWIRSGFKEKDPKKYLKGLATFPFQGLFLISDFLNAISSGYELNVPALKGFTEMYYGIKGKKPYTKIKHLIKAIGTFAGKPIDATWLFGEGAYDLMKGKTHDIRRLIYSKKALGEKQEDEQEEKRKKGKVGYR